MITAQEERPPSLLAKKHVDPKVAAIGISFAVGAHILIPLLTLASQWLLVMLGLAVNVEDRRRPVILENVVAAEFVKLGKPFDPTKLPNRKVPPVAKRRPDGVVVSKDAQEQPEKQEDKEKPAQAQDSMLDNLVDRTRDFAEDVEYEQEGDPNGIAEGTATVAKEGDIYRGKLMLFFRRGWTVPNVVQNTASKKALVAVDVDADCRVTHVELSKSSGDPLFDQSGVDAVQALIDARAALPEPPLELHDAFCGTTIGVNYDGKDAR